MKGYPPDSIATYTPSYTATYPRYTETSCHAQKKFLAEDENRSNIDAYIHLYGCRRRSNKTNNSPQRRLPLSLLQCDYAARHTRRKGNLT